MTGAAPRPVIAWTPKHAALPPEKLIRVARVRRRRTDDLTPREAQPSKQPQSSADYQAGFYSAAGA